MDRFYHQAECPTRDGKSYAVAMFITSSSNEGLRLVHQFAETLNTSPESVSWHMVENVEACLKHMTDFLVKHDRKIPLAKLIYVFIDENTIPGGADLIGPIKTRLINIMEQRIDERSKILGLTMYIESHIPAI